MVPATVVDEIRPRCVQVWEPIGLYIRVCTVTRQRKGSCLVFGVHTEVPNGRCRWRRDRGVTGEAGGGDAGERER